ncbi:ABC transporter substrate-binding protein [Alkalihalobacterium bogoriense]|uniref:ABC transporter substrate-binding protein n=1 Tax=Alkalihalobacterium bogoriense TaxID=246272 RepID=UPI00047C87AB|nr:ABC transporter substrate-binding protein [Alkalihalobacterium bogoriense]
MKIGRLKLSIVYVCLLLVVGCQNKESSDLEATDEQPQWTPVTFTYFNAVTNGQNIYSNMTTLGKRFEEDTGVNIKVEYPSNDLDTTIGVMIASGQYPDMMSPDVAIDKIMEADAFIPLNDLMEEHAPNLKKVYEPYLDLMTHEDGNIYFIPFGASHGFLANPDIDQGAFWIQRGILKEFGYPEVITLDEYFHLIESYVSKYPEINGEKTIGFTALTNDWRFFAMTNPPAHLAGYPNDGDVIVNMETFKASVYGNKEMTKRYLKKLNEINDKGLFDDKAFVTTYEEYLDTISSGRVLGFFDYRWQVGQAFNYLSAKGDDDREYMALPIVFDEGIKDQYVDPPSFNSNRGIGITKSADDPVRIMQFWDYLMEEENQKLISWGIEGETYEVNEDGRYYRTKEQMMKISQEEFKEQFGISIFEWYWPRGAGLFPDGNAWEARRQPEVAIVNYTKEEQVLLEAYNLDVFSDLFAEPKERPWFPAWSAHIEPGSDAAIFKEQAQRLQRLWYPQLVLCKPSEFEGKWEEYVNEYEQLNIEAYEKVMNEFISQRIEWSKDRN